MGSTFRATKLGAKLVIDFDEIASSRRDMPSSFAAGVISRIE
jgi:hypothetical protein